MSWAVRQADHGLRLGLSPQLTFDGTGGSYILRDAWKRPKLIFKPLDEESFAPSNPRGYIGKLGSASFRPGVLSGESCYREVAASILDRSQFSEVPETVLAELAQEEQSKTGSLQLFVDHICCAEDYSYSKFTAEQVHKIGILDIRILNMDRNVANILVKENMTLTPIDHGLSIPDSFEIYAEDLCWMFWPQSLMPFSLETLEFIYTLDPLQDIQNLHKLLPFRDKCLRNIRAAGILLKKGAMAGLNLHEIGTMLYRTAEGQPSDLEKILNKAEEILASLLILEENKLANKKRHRAYSSNEGFALDLSYESIDTLVVAIPELDDEESDDGTVYYQGSKGRSLSMSVVSEVQIKKCKREQAFDEKLFRFVEAFIEQAIKTKFKERVNVGRLRSYSEASYNFK